ASTKNYVAAAEEAEEAHGRLRLATAGTTREFIILGHELLVGNFSRMPGSLLVLAERASGLHDIVTKLAGSTGLWVAGTVAAAGAIAYLLYQLYEERKAVEEVSAAMLLTGQTGSGMQFDNIRASIEEVRKSFGATKNEAREAALAFASVTGI